MYGITATDIEFINDKIEFQRSYLENFQIEFGDKSINMLDNTYSANLNPKKYFSEINNRVNTMFQNAKDKGLKPVFVTLTAPTQYHNKYKDGNLRINPNDTAKSLTQIWNKFTNLKVFQKMKKELGHGLVYFRVYEPHKSAVPHLHAMLFIPSTYILDVKKKFKEYFSSNKWGANKKAIDFRYTWYKEKGGAVAYIMKYITKTFKDETNISTQHAVYWYIKHKVRRFLSSRTLAPLSMYRKIRYYFKENFEDDFNAISKMIAHGTIYKSFNNTMINYRYINADTGEVDDVVIWSKNADLLLKSRFKSDARCELNYVKKEIKKPLYAKINGLKSLVYSEIKKEFTPIQIVPSQLGDYKLSQHFHKLEKEDINSYPDIQLKHFLLTKNEMIKRELLDADIEPLEDEEDCILWLDNKTIYLNIKF